jgi:hypothetical protein
VVASHGSHVRLSFGVGADADSGVSPVLPGRSAERVFAAKNSVTGDCCGDAGGFSTLRKAAMQRTPTSRKSGSNTPHRPCYLRPSRHSCAGSCPSLSHSALSVSTTGVRADGTWCAHYGTGLEGRNCGFYSLSNAARPYRGSVDFAKPIYSRQGNRDGVIGATIRNPIDP